MVVVGWCPAEAVSTGNWAVQRRIIIGSLLLMVAAVVFGVTLTRPRTPLRVLVSFSGFRTAANGILLADFRITNQSGLLIHLVDTYLVKQPPRGVRSNLSRMRACSHPLGISMNSKKDSSRANIVVGSLSSPSAPA